MESIIYQEMAKLALKEGWFQSISNDGSKKLYDVLLDHFHAPNSLQMRLEHLCKTRWSNIPHGLATHSFKLVPTTLSNFILISKLLPPKVHVACVRFVFNSFHTAKRYQSQTPCVFCRKESSVDSIEHMLQCQMVLDCLPRNYHSSL